MLVLTRKKSESVSIGNDVVITITQIGAGKVKLGIVAPAHVRIRRSELVSFETEPSLNPAERVETGHAGTDAVTEDAAIEENQNDSPVDFTTEYAAEIEDQMRCILAYSHRGDLTAEAVTSRSTLQVRHSKIQDASCLEGSKSMATLTRAQLS